MRRCVELGGGMVWVGAEAGAGGVRGDGAWDGLGGGGPCTGADCTAGTSSAMPQMALFLVILVHHQSPRDKPQHKRAEGDVGSGEVGWKW